MEWWIYGNISKWKECHINRDRENKTNAYPILSREPPKSVSPLNLYYILWSFLCSFLRTTIRFLKKPQTNTFRKINVKWLNIKLSKRMQLQTRQQPWQWAQALAGIVEALEIELTQKLLPLPHCFYNWGLDYWKDWRLWEYSLRFLRRPPTLLLLLWSSPYCCRHYLCRCRIHFPTSMGSSTSIDLVRRRRKRGFRDFGIQTE